MSPLLSCATTGGAVHNAGALLQHEVDVHARGDLDAGVVAPGAVGVRPSLHAQAPVAGRVGGQARLVAVQARQDLDHAGAGAVGAVGAHEDGGGAEAVVALAEDGGADGEDLARNGLDRPAPVLDDREDLGDRDAPDGGVGGRERRGRGRRPGGRVVRLGGIGAGGGGRVERHRTRVRGDAPRVTSKRGPDWGTRARRLPPLSPGPAGSAPPAAGRPLVPLLLREHLRSSASISASAQVSSRTRRREARVRLETCALVKIGAPRRRGADSGEKGSMRGTRRERTIEIILDLIRLIS